MDSVKVQITFTKTDGDIELTDVLYMDLDEYLQTPEEEIEKIKDQRLELHKQHLEEHKKVEDKTDEQVLQELSDMEQLMAKELSSLRSRKVELESKLDSQETKVDK
jgi:hypothetical protein